MKKIKALFEIALMISLTFVFSLINSPIALAAPVCCEKTKTNEFCQYVDESQCQTGLRDLSEPSKGSYALAPTSCANTNFCKPGCCYDKEGDGYCYANYPRSTCETQYSGKFSIDEGCSKTPECALGCCVLGTQAFLSTEVRCKKETSIYPDLQMEFKKDITTETSCTALARKSEKGCCVSESGCNYGTRQECTATEGSGNGFFKDNYCSQIGKCSCAPANPTLGGKGDAKSTRCVDGEDSVFWKDSCGNQEGIATQLKGQCSYANGNLCGDRDKDGKYTCENLECESGNGINTKLSVNLAGYQGTSDVKQGGVKNGESWCQYDSKDQDVSQSLDPSKSPVGSRYYRSVCINGKELVEPCKDYRQEYCVAGIIEANVDGKQKDFTEARCIKNEWQSCVDSCNTADPFKMTAEAYKEALENDQSCCLQNDKRDCSWVGKCIPAVGPGFKHWEADGANTCGKANAECPVVLTCTGTQSLLGQCEKDAPGTVLASIATVVAGVGGAMLIAMSAGAGAVFMAGGLSAFDLIAKEVTRSPGWHVVSGQECLSKDYVQAANNLCRSYGDCGANVNYEGKLSLTGFINTKELPKEYYGAQLHLNKQPEERKALEDLSYANRGELRENMPGRFDEKTNFKPEWAQCTTAGDCAKKQPIYQFTFSEEGTFTDRFKARAVAGLDVWGPFAIGTGAILGTGIASALSSQAIIQGVSTPAIFGSMGPLGKLIQLVGPDSVKQAVTTELTTAAYDVAVKEATAQASTKIGSQTLNALPEVQQKLFTDTFTKEVGKSLSESQVQAFSKGFSEKGIEVTLKDSANIFTSAQKEAIQKAAQTAQKEVAQEVGKETVKNAGQVAEIGLGAQFLAAANAALWVDLAYELTNVVFSQTKVEKVKTTCNPWIAPKVTSETEDQCERCNPNYKEYVDKTGKALEVNAYKVCSEYRCKSLGLTCSLINQGTGEEQCVSLSKFDVNSPKITAWKEGFDQKYQNSIDEGKSKTDQIPGITLTKEIPIYEKINVALQTDEPSQCKMSFTQGKQYKDMEPFYFGGTTYTYFHVQPISYPATANVTEGTLKLTKGGGEYTVYVRCEDAVGNANEKDYFVKFSVGKEPDATPPNIIGTSIGQEIYLTAGATQSNVDVIVNEPSECKWSYTPTSYKDMPPTNLCKTALGPDRFGNYNCRFSDSGTGDVGPALKDLPSKAGEIKFAYFKCQDRSPAKNFNQEPYKVTLKGSNPLKITSVEPTGEIKTSLQLENITLKVKTEAGAKIDGTATCRFTRRESLKTNIPGMDDTFAITNSSTHTYPLILPTGQHTIYVGCVDEAGNTAFGQTVFSVTADFTAPTILKAYKQDQPTQFVVVVAEDAECRESTSNSAFNFEDGNKLLRDGNHHSSSSDPASTPNFIAYYIRCKDVYGNIGSVTTINVINQA